MAAAPKLAIRHTFNILSNHVISTGDTRYFIINRQLTNDKGLAICNADAFTFGEEFGFVYCFIVYDDYLYVYDLAFNKIITRDLPLQQFTHMCFANSLLYMQVDNVVFVYQYSENRLLSRIELAIGETLAFEHSNHIITYTPTRVNYYTVRMALIKHVDLPGYVYAVGVNNNDELMYKNDNGVFNV